MNQYVHYRKFILGETFCGYSIDLPGTSFTTTSSEILVTCPHCKKLLIKRAKKLEVLGYRFPT